jgi:glycosyltransferase involved in cell wall biosynthesis
MVLGYGVDVVVDETARRLLRGNCDVNVFVTRVAEPYLDTEYTITDLLDSTATPTDIHTSPFMRHSLRVLKSQHIDVWIIHTPPFYSWLPYLKSPVITVEHGTPPCRFFEEQLGKELDARTRERYHKTHRTRRPGDALVAISHYIRSGLPADVQQQTSVIWNGADHYPPASRESAEAFRHRLGVGKDDVLVLWVGRIQPDSDTQPYKGLDELIQVAPILKAGLKDIKLVAVGRADNSAREPLESAGMIPAFNLPREEMPIAFAAADIFLNTSRWEGFNMPLVEAQFQGTPVVAYDLCSHSEVVLDGDSGLLVNSREELCDATLKLARDPELRVQLAAGARKHARQFSWDTNTRELAALIERCRRQGSRHPTRIMDPANGSGDQNCDGRTRARAIRRGGFGRLLRKYKGWLTRG